MFAAFFIDRPKFAFVISIVTALIGVICLWQLPIAEYPEIAPPTVKVTAMYPGATSQVIAETVAGRLIILNGVKNGETVVVDGTHKIRPDVPVVPVDAEKVFKPGR